MTKQPRFSFLLDEIQIGDMNTRIEKPFHVGVLADLTGQPQESLPRLEDRKFIEIDQDNLDRVLERFKPRLEFTVRNTLHGGKGQLPIELVFRKMADFEPAEVLKQVKPLSALFESRTRLDNLRRSLNDKLEDLLLQILAAIPHGSDAEEPSTLEQIAQQGRLGQNEEELRLGIEWLREFLGQVQRGEMPVTRDLRSTIIRRVNSLDKELSLQLDEILHKSHFQALEATWRGLDFLVQRTPSSTSIRIRVFNVSKKELLKSLQKAGSPERSVIFKKIFLEEISIFGGVPINVLIGDYYISHALEDVDLLERMSAVCQAAHVPFIAAASPSMFNLDSFSELKMPRSLSKIFAIPDYTSWRRVCQLWSSRYIGLVVPRILMRAPYRASSRYADEFNYEECVDGSDNAKYLWGNSAYAFCLNLIIAFERYGWFAEIRGLETGGMVIQLPVHRFQSPEGDMVQIGPLDASIWDRRRDELSKLGFIAFCDCKRSNRAVVFDAPSCHNPTANEFDHDRWKSAQSVQLDYLITGCHIMHGILMAARDSIIMHGISMAARDSKLPPTELRSRLTSWLNQYVPADEPAPDKEAATLCPLRDVSLEVSDAHRQDRTYEIVARFRPKHQFAETLFPLKFRSFIYV